MNCQQINKFLYAFAEGSLDHELRAAIEQHIKECDNCRNNYKLTLVENEVLQEKTAIPILDDLFTARLMNKINPYYKPMAGERNTAPRKTYNLLTAIFKHHKALLSAASLGLIFCFSLNHFYKPADSPNLHVAEQTSQLAGGIAANKNTSGEVIPSNPEIIVAENPLPSPERKAAAVPQNTAKKSAASIKSDSISQDIPTTTMTYTKDTNDAPTSTSQDDSITTKAPLKAIINPSRNGNNNYGKESLKLNNQKPALVPDNVPAEYTLTQVKVIENESSFIYQQTGTNTKLKITIVTNEVTPKENTQEELMYSSVQNTAVDTAQAAGGASGTINNRPSEDQTSLRIIISGDITPEEIVRLTNLITIKEEL
jgi:hypothetical protein